MSSLYDVVRQFSGTTANISIPRVYIQFCDGNYNLATVLSQLVFWSDKGQGRDGWFYRPYKDLGEELCLSVDQVRYAVNGLKKRLGDGVLETKRKKVFTKLSEGDPLGVPVVHFKLDQDALLRQLFPTVRMGSENLPNENGDIYEQYKNNDLQSSEKSPNWFGNISERDREDLRNLGSGNFPETMDSGNFPNLVLTDPKTDPKTDLSIAPSNGLEPKELPEFLIPTNRKGEFYEVYPSEIQDNESLYPAVDVRQQYRKMIGWSNSNPKRRKTRKGMPRFINSWLSGEQDKGSSRTSPQEQRDIEPADDAEMINREIYLIESNMNSISQQLAGLNQLDSEYHDAAKASLKNQLKKLGDDREAKLAKLKELAA